MTFACIFTGFAESRPWECRVFSFKIERTSQKSRVFPFTFAPSCRKSLVLCVFFFPVRAEAQGSLCPGPGGLGVRTLVWGGPADSFVCIFTSL